MTISAAQLLVKVNADTSAAQAGLGGLATLMGPGGVLGLGAIGLAVAVAGIGIASTKMAGDFQAGLTTLVTGAGLAQGDLGKVHDALLQMAVDTGTSTKQLTDGLYMISSAGFNTSQSLAILKVAAEGAKVGNADLGTVADAVTTVLKNYPDVTNGAAGAMNTLIATVANGKTHMQDLALALANVLPTARQAGIGLNDVMAAMAAQTAMGIPAADAATHLRQMIIALMAPSKQASKALADVGLTTDQVAAAMHKSLPDAIALITHAISNKFKPGSAQYMAALKEISGGSREMQGMLALSGHSLASFGADVGKIAGQVKKGGNSIEGWSLVQGTFNQKMSVLAQTVETLMIKLGEKLLPILGRLVDWLAKNLNPAVHNTVGFFESVSTAVQRFTGFLQSNSPAADATKGGLILLTGALVGFGAYLLATAIPAIIASVTAFGAQAVAAGAAALATMAAAAPFILIGIAIAAVAIGIYELITHWKQVSAWFEGVWKVTVAGVVSGFTWLGDQVGKIVGAVVGWFDWLYKHNYYFQLLVDTIKRDFQNFAKVAEIVWKGISTGLSLAWNAIRTQAEWIWKAVVNTIITDIHQLQVIGGWLNDHVIKPITGLFSGIISTAESWGSNLMKMFIKGLQMEISDMKMVATNVMKGLAAIFGFHSPAEEGPGSDADTWAPNLMRMFAGGILAAAPTIASAASAVMGGVKVALSSGGGSLSLSAGGGGGGSGGGSGLAALPAGLSGGAGGAGGGRQIIEIHLTTQLDSRTVARQVLQVAPQLVQYATGHKNGGS